MAKTSRIPSAVGAIPVVGDLAKRADNQAKWVQELVEQNARLVGQLPTTIKTFNDTLERFNQTVARLDTVVSGIEATAAQLVAPLEQVAPTLDRIVAALDVQSLRDFPDVLDALRREALPALRATTDTQQQVALLTATVDGLIGLMNELPGAALMRRLAGGRVGVAEAEDPNSP